METSSAKNTLSRRGFVKLAAGAAAAAGLMLALPGCGSDDGTDSAATSTASSDSGEAKEIKIIVSNSNKPYCYLDTDGTTITGYDVESLKLMEEKLGGKYSFSFDAMDFNTMISSLQSNACDMVSCCLVPNEDRRAKFLFPDEPYCLCPMEMVVAEGSGIETLEDLAGKTIATSPTTYEYGMLQAYNEQYPDMAMELHEVDSGTVADYARMVANGQVDGTLCYESGFSNYEEAGQVELDHTPVLFTESTYYMLSQSQTELAEDLAEALREAKEDGSLGELSEKWFGADVFTEYADALSDNMLMAESSSDDDGEAAGSASADVSAD